jgi:hypothetical protein
MLMCHQLSPRHAHGTNTSRLIRKQKRKVRSYVPIGSIRRMLDVVIGLDVGVDWLSTNLEDTTKATVDWHRPSVSPGSLPIRGQDRRSHQKPATRQIVVEERLQQELFDRSPHRANIMSGPSQHHRSVRAIRFSGERPDIVGEYPRDDFALGKDGDGGWSVSGVPTPRFGLSEAVS